MKTIFQIDFHNEIIIEHFFFKFTLFVSYTRIFKIRVKVHVRKEEHIKKMVINNVVVRLSPTQLDICSGLLQFTWDKVSVARSTSYSSLVWHRCFS